jgi:PAS domain S-box-containing protein
MNDREFASADDRILNSEARFHLLLDTLPFIAFVIAPDGRAEHYNQCFADYHGLLAGAEKASRTELLHPDDRAKLVAARRAGAAAGTEYIVEARLQRHDGAYRWHRIHNQPLIRAGALAGWLGTADDIHDVVHANELLEHCVSDRTAKLETVNQHLTAEILQRQRTEEGLRVSEARYRLLYNRTPMALHSVNAEQRLIDVNDTWLAMFEYTRDEVIGRSPADFMTADSVERYRDHAWPDMLESGGQPRAVDYQFLTRSGHVFEGRLAASGDFSSDGRFERSWPAIADVTAEKRADRELRQGSGWRRPGSLSPELPTTSITC